MRSKLFVTVALVLCALAREAGAQQQFQLFASVADATGKSVATLEPADLRVMENGVEAKIVHVPTDTVVRYRPDWAGPLMGDKTWTVLFDNSKVKRVAGDFTCETDLAKILAEPVRHFNKRRAANTPYNTDTEAMIERIIADQEALGR